LPKNNPIIYSAYSQEHIDKVREEKKKYPDSDRRYKDRTLKKIKYKQRGMQMEKEEFEQYLDKYSNKRLLKPVSFDMGCKAIKINDHSRYHMVESRL
jgi:hypothetical protein